MNLIEGLPQGLGGGFWFLLILFGVVLDWLIGDPSWLPHPIVGMGKTISFLNKKLNRGKHRKAKGFLLLFLVLALTGIIVFTLQWICYKVNIFLYIIFNLYLIVTSLAAKTLATEVEKVMNALKGGDIEVSRIQVGYLVGRDTTELKEKEIIRATVETTAENTIDGVLAPLFYLLLGALLPVPWLNPAMLVMLYKATNTLDSMVGYIQEPYKDFGYAAAKFDDIINFIPARMGSFFMLIAGMFLGYPFKDGCRIFKRDRLNHKSPNSAHPESVVAGLLGIQLGGTNQYFGEILKKPTIGEAKTPLEIMDIRETITIMYGSEVAVMIISIIAAVLIFSF
ncbi:adenosylcobinamide-phosphate synthase CbiB [Acetobacterium tundrae]|uniref:adenosylcobinamide-phosphate synthase CbiB n=1 Tax=Acetobacterium tundrae TaxID=132932 RepID=UPI001FA95BA2|nr:adenosylcobinamide-phosphate synthase CbiB [Acetobacterium tundrae]